MTESPVKVEFKKAIPCNKKPCKEYEDFINNTDPNAICACTFYHGLPPEKVLCFKQNCDNNCRFYHRNPVEQTKISKIPTSEQSKDSIKEIYVKKERKFDKPKKPKKPVQMTPPKVRKAICVAREDMDDKEVTRLIDEFRFKNRFGLLIVREKNPERLEIQK